jgi:hypothetical protein
MLVRVYNSIVAICSMRLSAPPAGMMTERSQCKKALRVAQTRKTLLKLFVR